MSASRRRARARAGGFTLLELIAALAIGSVVLAALAGLIRNVGLSFEAGTRGVSNAERVMLAAERMTADFASARYLQRAVDGQVKSMFVGGPKKVAFVGAAAVAAGPQGDEVVVFEVEEAGDTARLVRRRARWLGHRTSLADVKPVDAVILLEGRLQIAFGYADRSLVWKDRWLDAPDLPRYVRLVLRDRATGAAALPPLDFPIRSDAPPLCSKAEATPACIPAAQQPQQAAPAAPAPAGGSSQR
ncbi:MAG: ral secretion pathway protein GspJ [Geminicoccaceae bacterium]|jgi:prepilin-type N-terminal cleavage/methylation domain-containing protein|nr:ral secretion pathway protein GspJ [Geminicoccaceae bacterium]MCE3247889.1 ral secretion pathway protein GspJ [Geminicoccaceae bacterium]MDF2765989.1 ral secretion pathway protein GspJ [Rhodospirillales bacterium]